MKSFLFWQPAAVHFSWSLFFFSHLAIWLLVLFLVVYFIVRRQPMTLLAFLILLFLSEVIEIFGKHFSPWPRPFYRLQRLPPPWLGHYSKGSFPSGHALRSALVLGFAFLIRWWWFFLLLPIIFLINYGRVYFGLHYPVDILAGFLLGGGLFLGYYYWCRRK